MSNEETSTGDYPADEWFSDDALAKQAALREASERGEKLSIEALFGIFAPRTQPTEDECCHNCGSDARREVDGRQRYGKAWCSLCMSRGRHDDYLDEIESSAATSPGASA